MLHHCNMHGLAALSSGDLPLALRPLYQVNLVGALKRLVRTQSMKPTAAGMVSFA